MSIFNQKETEHIKRLLFIIIAIVLLFAVARIFFIPKDFWQFGHYRGGSIAENMNRPQSYAGSSVCQTCHEDKYTTWIKSRHQTVNCETCHSAALKHTEDPSSIKPLKPIARKFCLLCHGQNISKPKTFPQIDPGTHNPGPNCVECHNPHSPELIQ